MSSTCWQPEQTPAPAWDADSCAGTNQWTPGAASSSIACIAVACLAVACLPEPPPSWADQSGGPTWVCGEAPVVPPPSGGGGGSEVPVERAFSNGYSGGFS